ncbi:hypothetical protein [Streptomyces olivochromogenes]|uniref:hypothetical protein n=1 Tax=Streptomyces olivochromogenes TaxID=1963 RepID=UPI001F1EC285|nr:hypothetical protein [Streptomyces olivochromogenes]MCF3131873.1 hypothetical protein [Streptomyces olivochromogenes]
MRSTRPKRVGHIAALALLTPLTPLAMSSPAEAAPAPLTVTNPGFEQDQAGWTFTAGTGVATNLPHSGRKLIYLDGGTGKEVSQTITAGATGTYDLSAWVATGGAGGKFTVRVNGTTAGSVDLPSQSGYARYTVSRVPLNPGDQLQIAFESGSGWVNADDVMVSPAAPADPVVTSSDPRLVEMFDWAKRKANSWVQLPGTEGPLNVDERNTSGTGTGTYGPSYWAGYAHRSGYYSRDMVHQLAGAAVLGLDAENQSMLKAFAASSTAEHKYFPVWAMNFDNKTYLAIDYHGPTDFVREVPAGFELVEKANQAYRWTGDSAYVRDSTLWDFYRHTTDQFVSLHDGDKPNGVAEGTGKGIFAGTASYDEVGDEPLREAGDAIGSQYQAYLAMAALAKNRGDEDLARTYTRKAAGLKCYFNSTWSGTGSGGDMVRGYTTDGRPLTGWGKENSWFMPMKRIIEAGPRNDAYLDFIDQQASGSGKPSNVEAISYLPDTFFANNRNDTAWKWMRYVYDQRNVRHPVSKQGPNGDYPEVSFTLVGQTVQGLMGVEPDAPDHALSTQSRLPSGTDWTQIKDLKIGDSTFTLRHDGPTKSTLTHSAGTHAYQWEARFLGRYGSVEVNGAPRKARTKVVDGVTYTYVKVALAPGRSASVEVGN